MTHINNIGAGLYSDLSVSTPASPEDIPALLASATLEQDLKDLFVAEKQSTQATPATGDYVRITNVREFPSMVLLRTLLTYLCMVRQPLSRFRVSRMLRPLS